VCAYDTHTSRLLWSKQTSRAFGPAWILTPPALGARRLWVSSQNGSIYCLEKRSGVVVWEHYLGRALGAVPLPVNGAVLNAGFDSALTALSMDRGTVLWRLPLGEEIEYAGPRPMGGLVFLAGRGGTIFCIDPERHVIQWQRKLGGFFRRPVSVTSTLLCASDDVAVYGLDPRTGLLLWRVFAPGAVAQSRGRVFVAGNDGVLRVLRADNGHIEETHAAAAMFPSSQPIIADDLLVIAGRGVIQCFRFSSDPAK
jgi:outer membrane protein assembly factor BamB